MAEVMEQNYETDAARWSAVVQRDAQANGSFYYAVATTGIFCRPACGARTPRREHVRFFETIIEAEAAGFRACKRCKPKAEGASTAHADMVAAACRWIESAEKAPTLAQLAERVGLSSYYFHRIFKQYTGVTPKAYARGQLGQRLREALTQQASVTDAIYAAGYEASSRFYAEMPQRLGMRPAQYHKGGEGLEICHDIVETDLGFLLMAATAKGLCLIQFGESRAALLQLLAQHFPRAEKVPVHAALRHWLHLVTHAIANGATPSTDLPLDIRGTAFQMKVWEALRRIPAGETASYAQVATAMGQPRAVRAVANACGQNPVALTVPCHRVVRSDGSLGGYRWGETRKRELLEREGVSS